MPGQWTLRQHVEVLAARLIECSPAYSRLAHRLCNLQKRLISIRPMGDSLNPLSEAYNM